jgi:hypothetical protein
MADMQEFLPYSAGDTRRDPAMMSPAFRQFTKREGDHVYEGIDHTP